MSVAIRVEQVSKKFRLGRNGDYSRLSETLQAPWQRLWKRLQAPADQTAETKRDERFEGEEFWALRDVSFEVPQGEVFGIIGRNGAGKSTLLKILSRITRPTSGRICTRGRVGSLLEVGTGFHPELTGRENIFLNGSILGMSRREILNRFDEIVQFAEVSEFIDTPVKRYSSGMYTRLAFSVAAHLEPDILIIDEVLAVGDVQFQKKCLGKMQDVASHGRTVLFVSHNLAAVKQLCQRGLLLEGGKVIACDQIAAVSERYAKSISNSSGQEAPLPNNELIHLQKVHTRAPSGECLTTSSGIEFEIQFELLKLVADLDITLEIQSQSGFVVMHQGVRLLTENEICKPGLYQVRTQIDPYILNQDGYWLTLIFGQNSSKLLFNAPDVMFFEIQSDGDLNSERPLPGVIAPKLNWQIEIPTNH